ncbi:DUF3667 domain-containing protein [Maribacter algicola]|uniref:DUF3667 domain-containing protein n=1 Tax=Meishania litoralis TaxID=3434685 RepID=A0ACC7LNA3_9FLAO
MDENKPTIKTTGRYKLQYRGTECTNCAHPLDMSDKYCPNCSQANSTKKLTLKDFFDEFFSSLISYDSKLLNTLSAMLLKPGKITSDYINGKRVRYTNPFRFLLSLSIVYFLMLNIGGDFSTLDRFAADNETGDFNMEEGIMNLKLKKNDVGQDIVTSLDSIPELEKINEQIKKKDSLMIADPKAHYDTLAQKGLIERFFDKRELFGTLIDKKGVRDLSEITTKYDIPTTTENKTVFNAAKSISKAKKRPSEFFSSLISKVPFAIFFFLPLFALFIQLAYIRKKYNYTDHLIFSFHNTSALIILLIISYLIDSVFGLSSNGIFLLLFLIYLFLAMKRFYRQGIFKTGVKYMYLNTVFFILATFSTLLFFIGNIFTF